jgi:hypothetical protein
MVTTLGTALYRLSQTSKNAMSFLLFLMFSLQQSGEQDGGKGSAWKLGAGEVAQIMCTHVSKCKNNKK